MLGLTAIMLAIVFSAGNAVSHDNPASGAGKQSIAKVDFRKAMRKLWEDHVTWTRLYIVSALADLPDKDLTAQRLLQNQTDIGNAVKPFYGEAAGAKLTSLLKDHILIAADLIAAVKSGETEKSSKVSAQWNDNADAIAGFLSGANPKNWTLKETKEMMHEHLASTTAEVVARLKKDWKGDIQAYDKVHNQILEMADMLSEGIMNQFSAKFF